MPYRISLTPTANRNVKELRGRAADSFQRAVGRLEAEGCAAADYRLSGNVVDRICSLHLYGRFRVLLCFPESDRIVILLVGEHLRHRPDNVYDSLYRLFRMNEPHARRSKPPCCDDEGKPPVDPSLVRHFRATSSRLRRGR